jgi:hypothetical protein
MRRCPLTWAFGYGAGEGNRTLTVSLGIAGTGLVSGLAALVTAALRGLEYPRLTWVNGTAIMPVQRAQLGGEVASPVVR